MSGFYDDASWLLIPEGIEEDIVFAQKPTNGTGDLSFTRASDATRTNSAGVIERTPWNLFTQSVWTGGGLNVAPTGWSQGQTSGNFEPLTAINGNVPYRFYGTIARRYITQTITLNAGQDFIVSVFVDSVTISSSIANVISTTASVSNLKYYVNNVEVTSSTPITANTRIAISFTATVSASGSIRIGGGVGGGTTYDFVISQPQASEGTDAKPYFATTNRQDVPRLDYHNADGSVSTCPRLLLEPQRTNSIRNSTNVGAVAGTPGTLPTNWSTVPRGLTQTIVATGTINGLPYIDLRFVGTAAGNTLQIFPEPVTQIVAATGQTWTGSIWAQVLSQPSPAPSYSVVLSERSAAGSGLGTSTTPFGTSFNRVTLTRTLTNVLTERISIGLHADIVTATAYDFTIRIAAPQMELGAYATTFIPTTTAAVTRLADLASKTGVSSLIGQTEGTLFVDCVPPNGVSGRIFAITDASLNNRIAINYNTNNRIDIIVRTDNVITNGTISASASTQLNPGVINKIAFAYKSDEFALYINGSLAGTVTGVFSVTAALQQIGASELAFLGTQFMQWNQAALFPTRLTNAQLAQLTTL